MYITNSEHAETPEISNQPKESRVELKRKRILHRNKAQFKHLLERNEMLDKGYSESEGSYLPSSHSSSSDGES